MTVAIIIASYNRKATLLQAVQSALKLHVPVGFKKHIIVVDDGSKDQSFESLINEPSLSLIEKQFELTDLNIPVLQFAESEKHNLAVLRCENAERGLARNRGAQYCQKKISADWFLFLDSDDCLTETALLRFNQTLQLSTSSLPVLVYSWFALWDGINSPTLSRQKFSLLPEGDLSVEVLKQTFIPLGASLISAKAFFEAGQFPVSRSLSGSEDKILITRLAFLGPIAFCKQVAVWYRQHGSNTDRNAMLNSIELTESELIPDIEKKFGSNTKNILKKFRRHSFYKMIGYSIFNRDFTYAFYLFITGAFKNIALLLDLQYWKMLLIFGFHLIKSLIYRKSKIA